MTNLTVICLDIPYYFLFPSEITFSKCIHANFMEKLKKINPSFDFPYAILREKEIVICLEYSKEKTSTQKLSNVLEIKAESFEKIVLNGIQLFINLAEKEHEEVFDLLSREYGYSIKKYRMNSLDLKTKLL